MTVHDASSSWVLECVLDLLWVRSLGLPYCSTAWNLIVVEWERRNSKVMTTSEKFLNCVNHQTKKRFKNLVNREAKKKKEATSFIKPSIYLNRYLTSMMWILHFHLDLKIHPKKNQTVHQNHPNWWAAKWSCKINSHTLVDKYPGDAWKRVYTDESAHNAVRSGALIQYSDNTTDSICILTDNQCTNYDT